MSSGKSQPGTCRPWAPWLALLLWLASVILGLQAIYSTLQLFYLIFGGFGGNMALAQRVAPAVVFVSGLVAIMVILGSAEYHRTRVDQPQSWRLFAWVLGAELALVLLHAFLL